MVDSKKIDELIEWYKNNTLVLDFNKLFFTPILEALGENEEEIKKYLESMNIEDLDYISGVFEDIYGKFLNDDMYDFLGTLEEKIKKYNNDKSIH